MSARDEVVGSGLKSGARFVAYVIAVECVNNLDKMQPFRVDPGALAEATGIGRATVRKYLAELVAGGWLDEIEPGTYRWAGEPDTVLVSVSAAKDAPGQTAEAAGKLLTRDVSMVFETWRDTMPEPGRSRLKLTKGRADKIRTRMREGWSVAELCDAVRGWSFDPWEERAKHNDIEVLLRNTAQVEKFLGLYRGESVSGPSVAQGTKSVANVVGAMKQRQGGGVPQSHRDAVDAAIDEAHGRNLPVRRGLGA